VGLRGLRNPETSPPGDLITSDLWLGARADEAPRMKRFDVLKDVIAED
jgi:hypothetical protein